MNHEPPLLLHPITHTLSYPQPQSHRHNSYIHTNTKKHKYTHTQTHINTNAKTHKHKYTYIQTLKHFLVVKFCGVKQGQHVALSVCLLYTSRSMKNEFLSKIQKNSFSPNFICSDFKKEDAPNCWKISQTSSARSATLEDTSWAWFHLVSWNLPDFQFGS